MMNKDDYQHFVCIVAGNNPEELMQKYDKYKINSPRVVYYYKDVDKIKKTYIQFYEKMLSDAMSNGEINIIKDAIDDIKTSSNEEFFEMICEDNDDYYFDNETGDIKTNVNENGKWSSYQLGKAFSIPFLTKDGREIFQSLKKDVDWEKIHLAGNNIYARVWEMCMENSIPNDEHEKILFDNMKDKIEYFKKFETKENYIVSNTAFWGYAFLSEQTGWLDAEDENNQFTWMSNYYDIFIKNLPDDTTLTIYECRK